MNKPCIHGAHTRTMIVATISKAYKTNTEKAIWIDFNILAENWLRRFDIINNNKMVQKTKQNIFFNHPLLELHLHVLQNWKKNGEIF